MATRLLIALRTVLLLTALSLAAAGCSRGVLGKIDGYDAPKQAGTTETYDSRKSGNLPVPANKVETLVADVWQRLTMDLHLKVDAKTVTEADVAKGIDIYATREWTKIAGYRPYTHASFIKSLSADDRKNLVKEITEHMHTKGVNDPTAK